MALLAGCAEDPGSRYDRLQHEDPLVRVEAIIDAGQAKDAQAVPYIVDRLGDQDQAVRFYAILALERITGQRLGYSYAAPPAERKAAEARWRQWLARRRGDGSTTRPTVATTTAPTGPRP